MARAPRTKRSVRSMKGAFNPDTIEKFFDHGLHIPTRTLYVGSVQVSEGGSESGVDAKLAEQVIKGIHLLEQQSRRRKITLILNNPGGYLVHGLAIYDALCYSPCPIVIKVFGEAASMGSIILQAGNERIVSPHATLMIHHGGASMEGTFEQMKTLMENWERAIENIRSILLRRIREKNPNFEEERLRKLMEKDTFLSATETVSLGLADKIQE